jgi:hypothetical protein
MNRPIGRSRFSAISTHLIYQDGRASPGEPSFACPAWSPSGANLWW